MKLFNHFTAVGFSNTYLIGPDEGGDAILVDPGSMDVRLLGLIEDNNYYIRHVLITHAHPNHFRGIKTILKIYDAKIYSKIDDLEGTPCTPVDEGILKLGDQNIEVLSISGHSFDSLVYKYGHFYFTGDVLSAGRTGTTPDRYTRALLRDELENKLFIREGHGILLPGHGPPSTIRAEKNIYNRMKEEYEEQED